MLDELKGRALLQGARGQAAADLGRLADVIARIARTAAQLGPQLQALEINPLWVRGADIEILDALVVFEEDSPGGREQES
jgi:succinyl-CoA synthetase beta subunit